MRAKIGRALSSSYLLARPMHFPDVSLVLTFGSKSSFSYSRACTAFVLLGLKFYSKQGYPGLSFHLRLKKLPGNSSK